MKDALSRELAEEEKRHKDAVEIITAKANGRGDATLRARKMNNT